MKMKILVLASQKGGVGKTTLAGHLAVEAATRGERVVVLDTDPQGSLSLWWNERAADDVACAVARLDALPDQLSELAGKGYTLAVIDTPGAISDAIAFVINAATLVVIPTRAGPHDLRAVGKTVALCESASRRPVFVINGGIQRARITTDAAIALSEHGAVAPTVIYQRVDYVTSMIDGRAAQELNNASPAAAEIKLLWNFIDGQLNKIRSQK